MSKHRTLLNYFQTLPNTKKSQTSLQHATGNVHSSATRQESNLGIHSLNKTSFAATKVKNECREKKCVNQQPIIKTKRRRIVDSDEEQDPVADNKSNQNILLLKSEAKKRKIVYAANDNDVDDNKGASHCSVKSERKIEKVCHSTSASNSHKSTNKMTAALCSFEYGGDTTSGSTNQHLFKTGGAQTSKVEDREKFLHETLEFLSTEKLKDINKNPPTDPMYDKTSLYIPAEFLKKQTPAMYQWWTLKSTNFDVVLFFKVGKFYELYHMDAVIGVLHLGLIYMKGAFAHCGFPEISFGRYSDALVEKGFSVARVEQTETPEDNKRRIKGSSLSKQEKSLRREICRITTKGTKLPTLWDSRSVRSEHNYLLAIKEKLGDGSSPEGLRQFGVCFVDTTLPKFHIGQFDDDVCCSKLCTLLAHYLPSQVLFERTGVSWDLRKILHTHLATTIQTDLISGTQFWTATKALQVLSQERYFLKDGETFWPEALKKMMHSLDLTQLSPLPSFELALSSLGACTYYLKKCLIDFQTISSSQFVEYSSVHDKQKSSQELNMVLDSICLKNLEVFNNSRGGKEGTLLDCLDSCQTAFGKRLLHKWLSVPSCCPKVINDRLDAIGDLLTHDEAVFQLRKLLCKMPDLERMLSNICFQSLSSVNCDHPESRAILYEEDKYTKKKINDFISLLEKYEATYQCIKGLQVQVETFTSNLLKKALGSSCSFGDFPDMEKTMKKWKNVFDWEKAKQTGKIVPQAGTNLNYDQAILDIKSINEELENYLLQQQKCLSTSQIVFKGSGNKRFQLELPESTAKSLPGDFVICGQRKGFKSFKTRETEKLFKKMESAENQRDAAQAKTLSIVFSEFVKDFDMWSKAVQYLAITDVLISLSNFSKGAKGVMCRPSFLMSNNEPQPLLKAELSRHPSINQAFLQNDFIPNNIVLGGSENTNQLPVCLLLTGPNMGGKSTLMRQVGLLTILAQIGCYVPAKEFLLTPCDRIFTRLGASDKIMSGESTFFVELSEASSILKHATKKSLVLVDELGRGTATYDGTAIAFSVLSYISKSISCRTIFSTHYHALVEGCMKSNAIKQGHMAIMVKESKEDDENMLTFLFKLESGSCPKSYGFHAARLAGISLEVTKLARTKATQLKKNNEKLMCFRKTWLSLV